MSARLRRHVQVFVAACSGSAKLSETIGLPVVHVDATMDAVAAIRRLNEREYASGVRVPAMFQPILFDCGWTDWAKFDYRTGPWRQAMGVRPDGVRVVDGRIEVALAPTAVAGVLTFPAFPFGDRDAYVVRVVDWTIQGLRAARVAPLT